MGKFIDLTGQRFGRLTVIERAEDDGYGNVRWMCRCDCGTIVIRHGHVLRRNRPSSCGCDLDERMKRIATKHGGKGTRLYSIWVDMIRRCEKPTDIRFDLYGGRGISVCDEWHNFLRFQEWALSHGYNETLTIDRIDNYQGYTPDNARWVTWEVQENNRRNNRKVTYNGKVHTIAEWARITKISKATIRQRLSLGWPVERALTEPVHKQNPKKK